MARETDASESEIRALWNQGDVDGATAAALRTYGAEIYGLLLALHQDRDAADEAFSAFTERLWSTMPAFKWMCSMRTWAYLLARNASNEQHRVDARDRRRQVPLSAAPEVAEVAARIRTRTRSVLRTENRTAIEQLRDELPEEDRLLLVLRIDRELAWLDVARIFAPADAVDDERTLTQEAARLRKRFQLVKERLRTLGRERGLL